MIQRFAFELQTAGGSGDWWSGRPARTSSEKRQPPSAVVTVAALASRRPGGPPGPPVDGFSEVYAMTVQSAVGTA